MSGMTERDEGRWQTFERRQEYFCVERRLPHWLQAGTLMFVTFRTADSMPSAVRKRWLAERCRFLRAHGIDPTAADWRQQLDRQPPAVIDAYHARLGERWNALLDAGHGACALREPAAARIVADSLLRFDGSRYEVTDLVVMPNHVHWLGAFFRAEEALPQFEAWKRYTARQIQRLLHRRGRFWQQDGFDHLVRSEASFLHYRAYIADNPRRARLRAGEYLHYSKS